MPLLAGVVLLTSAAIIAAIGDDRSILPFLMALVAGWCGGFAFVNFTTEMRPRSHANVLHTVALVALSALMIFAVDYGDRLVSGFPEPGRSLGLMVPIAGITATVWIFFGLLARFAPPSSKKRVAKKPPATPGWVRNDEGVGLLVRFLAVPLTKRALTRYIAGIATPGAAGTVALLIATQDLVMFIGPIRAVVLIGATVALPAYSLSMRAIRKRTLSCSILFSNDALQVSMDATTHLIPYAELDRLAWRPRSHYARIEVRGGGVNLSLMSGLTQPPEGGTAQLPPLPRFVHRELELAGMTRTQSRRREVTTFTRSVA